VVLHGVHLFHGIRHDLVLYHAHLLQSHPSLVQVQSRLFVQAQSHLDAQVQVQSHLSLGVARHVLVEAAHHALVEDHRVCRLFLVALFRELGALVAGQQLVLCWSLLPSGESATVVPVDSALLCPYQEGLPGLRSTHRRVQLLQELPLVLLPWNSSGRQ